MVAGLPGSARTSPGVMVAGDWMLIAWGWGSAVVFGVYIAGGSARLTSSIPVAAEDVTRNRTLGTLATVIAAARRSPAW